MAQLRTFAVSGPHLLEPGWFNQVRHGQHAAVVSAERTLELAGEVLKLRGDAPPAGTAVRVWLNSAGFFVCAPQEDLERQAQAEEQERAAAERRRREQLNTLRDEARAFNANIALPVAWDVGIKDVLSGLSESSWGDGRSRATVEHLLLLAPLDGRLQRSAGDFLCTAAKGSNGKRWSSKVVERAHDGDGATFQPKVTCKACLKLAHHWAPSPRAQQPIERPAN